MSKSRSSLIELLKNANAETIKKLQLSKYKLTSHESRNRIFDDFPNVLLPDDMAKITHSFNKIASKIMNVITVENGFDLNNTDKGQIYYWIKDLIELACDELLDASGNIKSDLINKLDWKNNLSPTEIFDIVCAYVGNLSQTIILAETYQNPLISPTICHYVSKNYSAWIEQELKYKGFMQEGSPLEIKHQPPRNDKIQDKNKRQESSADKKSNFLFFIDRLNEFTSKKAPGLKHPQSNPHQRKFTK